MQRLKKFSILLLSFLPITYAYGYEYIEIQVDNSQWSCLQLKKWIQFDNEDVNKNQAIISEIIIALESEDPIILIINLFNGNVGANIIDLFIQGLKENFQGKILRIGVNLLRNKIDYDTLKKFLNALSTEELYKKFALEGLNLLSNEIG